MLASRLDEDGTPIIRFWRRLSAIFSGLPCFDRFPSFRLEGENAAAPRVKSENRLCLSENPRRCAGEMGSYASGKVATSLSQRSFASAICSLVMERFCVPVADAWLNRSKESQQAIEKVCTGYALKGGSAVLMFQVRPYALPGCSICNHGINEVSYIIHKRFG